MKLSEVRIYIIVIDGDSVFLGVLLRLTGPPQASLLAAYFVKSLITYITPPGNEVIQSITGNLGGKTEKASYLTKCHYKETLPHQSEGGMHTAKLQTSH